MKRAVLSTALTLVLPLLAGVSCTQDDGAAPPEGTAVAVAELPAAQTSAGVPPSEDELIAVNAAPVALQATAPEIQAEPVAIAAEPPAIDAEPPAIVAKPPAIAAKPPAVDAEAPAIAADAPSIETRPPAADLDSISEGTAVALQHDRAGAPAAEDAVALLPPEDNGAGINGAGINGTGINGTGSADSEPATANTLAPQDGGQPPPAEEPVIEDDPPPADGPVKDDPTKSDEVALELLGFASKKQGGLNLAEPGGLQSFFVDFGRILVWRWSKGDDGKWNVLPEEVSAMDISWMRHDKKPSSLRTFWEVNGRQVTRAVSGRHGFYWLDDGKQVSSITKETHPDDFAEVNSHRRLSETLIDVAVLAKLQKDGSVWKTVQDDTYPGPALRRTPSAATGGLTFTMWLGEKDPDPKHIVVEPVEKGAPKMHYRLTYNDALPAEAFSVSGSKLRFPHQIFVEEEYEGHPKHKVMQLWVRRVAFNKVDEKAAFAPPKR